MPGGKTSFQSSWLEGYDTNKHKIALWCRRQSQYEAHCTLCDKTFSIANRGNGEILQHAGGLKHREIANTRFSKTTQHLTSKKPSNQNTQSTKSCEKELVLRESKVDQIKSAEKVWMLKVAESECFQVMFLVNFSLVDRKLLMLYLMELAHVYLKKQ